MPVWLDSVSRMEDLKQLLADAERHVAEAERMVARQRKVVDNSARAGRDTTGEQLLLQHYEASQALYIAARDRLRRTLGLLY